MVCLRCGTVFCPEESLPGGSIQLYCSKQCKKKASAKKKAAVEAAEKKYWQEQVQFNKDACAKRNKPKYPSIVEAREAAGIVFTGKGVVLYPYPCECGFFHLTHKKIRHTWLTNHEKRATMYA
jgi:hypothetical protein